MSAEYENIDDDSGFDEGESLSTSLGSSLQYESAYSREYYPWKGDYLFSDRLHVMFKNVLKGQLCAASLPKAPLYVLDVGTGTGQWAIDFADSYPGTQVVGIDIAPVQELWVPPNLTFYVDDIERSWIDTNLDLVHIRGMSGCVRDWASLLNNAYASLVPGGCLEFQEAEVWDNDSENTSSMTPYLQSWQQLCRQGASKHQRDIMIAGSMKQWMMTAGFIDVHEKTIKVPIGPWHDDPEMRELGKNHRDQMISCIEPFTFGYVGKCLGWKESECRVLSAKVVQELCDPNQRLFTRFTFVHGRVQANLHAKQ